MTPNTKLFSNSVKLMLVAVLVHIIPIGGVFMNGMWYKYPYILGSFSIGLMLFIKVYRWYLKNSH